MIYLDTHVVVWLYAGLTDKFSDFATSLINDHDLYISPMIRLELQYLYERGRISEQPEPMIADLDNLMGVKICELDFNTVIGCSLKIDWTRDPFDRIIVAHAAVNQNILLTKDRRILANYEHAQWEE
ncbi:PIN domain-containing protein [Lyngbya sp. CCY1209]|uniref:type II toxin-antitoxin system VapC family toxin n=1 Tax=Lyngbya sp. CCY1209 TaxID=2886103 RepID=UPI002D20C80C|nr:PIN domain-containing protein [Lyngbya sp. CCY1209]MEB3883112.1 PIN domain-containing protein [Lyngbya sp. CCY1209]